MVDDDQLQALREHFAAGAGQAGGVTADTAGGPPPVILNVLKLRLPARDGSPAVVVDGSSQNDGEAGAVRISACAALATDGRMLAGWYETPYGRRMSLHAEWQAARLGLRLAARYPDGVTLVTDHLTVAEQVRRAVTGKPLHGVIASGVSRDVSSEIVSLARGRQITAVCRTGATGKHHMAATHLGRVVHVCAWLVQRLAADGFDPREHVSWIAEVAAGSGRDKATLRRKYLRHVRSPDLDGLLR